MVPANAAAGKFVGQSIDRGNASRHRPDFVYIRFPVNITTERVGRYQLLEPIGTGPCGTVSRAKVFGVAGFERQFAVKRFHSELTITSALAQALSAAARAYGSLEHPRIARMAEFGVAQGQTFTAVELVPGLDALRLIAETRLGGTTILPGGALALVSQAARAVGYAHGRGLVHLGLAPTNVIVTADGDLKITDFSLLAAGLPSRPIDVARLAQRIQYLAPEQLANESTSAATDVFSLGVIAYELVTGQRTFRGDTPQQIAQAIMAGPPPEPALPRPIVRVLQRCLARSPFERFPDARALADALDAALRVAPVPGTRKDVGAIVKQTMERIAALHEGEMSGMLALNVSTGPMPRLDPIHVTPSIDLDSHPELETDAFVRPDTHVAGPPPLIGPASTTPDMPRTITTVTGLPPPPIPVPQGIAPPPIPSMASRTPASTLVGVSKVPIAVPQIKSRSNEPTQDMQVPMFRPSGLVTAKPAPRLDTEAPTTVEPPSMDALFPSEDAGDAVTVAKPAPKPKAHELMTEEMPPLLQEKLNDASTKGTSQIKPLVEEAWRISEFPDEAHASHEISALPPPTPGPLLPPPPLVTEDVAEDIELLEITPERSRAPLIIAAVLIGGAALAVGGWQLYVALTKPRTTDTATKVVTPAITRADAGTAIAKAAADATIANASGDAAVVAAVPADAATTVTAAPADAAVVAAVPADAKIPVAAPPATDTLTITSKPAGAHVFLDGSDSGVTPLKLPGSADHHSIALLLPGHDLYVAQIDGHGAISIPLKELTPIAGPAGIKVIKCKDKDRYYVFVDGKPTGQMCPTERIETDVGPHTVEVYDASTESRKKWDIIVKDTRLSYRVKVE